MDPPPSGAASTPAAAGKSEAPPAAAEPTDAAATKIADDIAEAIKGLELADDVALAAPMNLKRALVAPTEEEIDTLAELLKSQLKEGHGEHVLAVGVGDGGAEPGGLTEEELAASVSSLQAVADKAGAHISRLRPRTEPAGVAADYLVREVREGQDFTDVRVAAVGNVDAGKSTLLGVLTHGGLDDGRGKSRLNLFKHGHEAESGRTSAVSHDILGYDAAGAIVNKPKHDGSLDWAQVCQDAWKVVSFIDLCGHEKYLKTTVFGLTGHKPDYAMLMIAANNGVIGMTKEHLGLALALHVPVFVVVTKIDMCPPNVLKSTLKLLTKILKSPGCRKIPMPVTSIDDVAVCSANFVSERLCPIFQLSSVTGEGLDLVKSFVNLLSPSTPDNRDDPARYQIDETFSVPGVGTVVSGTMTQGTVKVGETLLMGPDGLGLFTPVAVKGIHRRRMAVTEVIGGQTASFALKKVKRSEIRKGMAMVSKSYDPRATWEFDAKIAVLHHPTTILPNYQAMVHVGPVRQTAAILRMNEIEQLRTGDKAVCRFRFTRHPELLQPNTRIVFREGRTKAVGQILTLIPPEEELAPGRIIGNRPQRHKGGAALTTAQRLTAAVRS